MHSFRSRPNWGTFAPGSQSCSVPPTCEQFLAQPWDDGTRSMLPLGLGTCECIMSPRNVLWQGIAAHTSSNKEARRCSFIASQSPSPPSGWHSSQEHGTVQDRQQVSTSSCHAQQTSPRCLEVESIATHFIYQLSKSSRGSLPPFMSFSKEPDEPDPGYCSTR